MRGNGDSISPWKPKREGVSGNIVRCGVREVEVGECYTLIAVKDSQTYPSGLKVTDEDVARLHLLRDAFHGEWTYKIKSQE